MPDTDFALVLSFDDDSPSFTHGFEVGRVWQRMEAKEGLFGSTLDGVHFHATNLPVFQRMAELHGYHCDPGQMDDEWVAIDFTRQEPARPKLKLVSNKDSANA